MYISLFEPRHMFIPFRLDGHAFVMASDPIAMWHRAQIAANDGYDGF